MTQPQYVVTVVVSVVTGEPVEQKLHRADIQVQLVHVMLTEVTDLQVPDEKLNNSKEFQLMAAIKKN